MKLFRKFSSFISIVLLITLLSTNIFALTPQNTNKINYEDDYVKNL